METSSIQLDELPDEILMIIFKKLCSIDILYSLLGVNKRLNKIVCDYVFTSCLTLIARYTYDLHYPLNNPMLDRFCSQILPQIRDKIKWMNVEPSSMERILLSTKYRNLNGLGLYDLEIERAEHLFTKETSLMDIFKNQISSLIVDITKDEKYKTRNDVLELIFTCICSMFTNLQCLHFGPSLSCCQMLSFNISRSTIFSSTLLELQINLRSILDCLYLLDGRFSQLHTLHVNIYHIISSNWLSKYNKSKLPNLRCFSLHCNDETTVYDEIIVPFLHRMPNLEKLDLHLVVRRKTFIDGNELKRNITTHLTRLKKFGFNMCSNIRSFDAVDLISNEDIQHTFRVFKDYQITSTVDYFPKERRGQCHIYSYPYNLKYYENITNNFLGGLFEYVSEISLYDERPFEHEFFVRIAQSFPFMKKLALTNKQSQVNNNQHFSIIKYPRLIELVLYEAHEDYVEQFLLDTKSYLPYNINLYVYYRPLKKVTHNFTRDATRTNCSKVRFSYYKSMKRIPEHFNDYFLCTYRIK